MLGSLGKLFVEIGADTSALDAGIDGAEKQVKGLGSKLAGSGKVIGAGMTVAGAGLMVLTDSSMKTNAALGVTAIQLGATKEEMRDLALETANVTFPLEEVTASFDLLSRAGMTNVDQMAATATAFDTLGDAIGIPASEVTTSLIPAFAAFGIPLEDATAHTDTFTHLMRNTTVELGDFSSMVNYLAADLDTMDISMNESVAVMEALAAQGIQGSAATREFRTAVSAADGDINLFYDALGLTADEVAGYSEKIEASTGITDTFAAAQNEQFTTMDKLKHAVSEATLQYGSFLEPLEALGPAMTTLGPLMIAASSMNWAHAASAWGMIAPYLAVIAPVLAVVAVLYILEKKFGVVTKTIDTAKVVFSTLVDWLSSSLVAGVDLANNVIGSLGDKLLFVLGPIGAVIYAFRNWEEIKGIVSGILGSVVGYITGLAGSFGSAGRGLMNAFVSGVTAGIRRAVAKVREGLAKIRRLMPGSDAKEGPLSDITSSGQALMSTFEKGINSSTARPADAFAARAPDVGAGGGAAGGSSAGGSATSTTFNIAEINLSHDYPFDKFMHDMEAYQRGKRMQRGIGAI